VARAKAESGDKTMTQTGMVRAALEELGADAKPLAIQEHIKTKFNKELPTSIISNYKSVMKRKGAGNGAAGRGRRPGRPPRGGGLQIADLEAVRALVRRLGADNVRRLVDVVT
jgi:hypothetical protein